MRKGTERKSMKNRFMFIVRLKMIKYLKIGCQTLIMCGKIANATANQVRRKTDGNENKNNISIIHIYYTHTNICKINMQRKKEIEQMIDDEK